MIERLIITHYARNVRFYRSGWRRKVLFWAKSRTPADIYTHIVREELLR